MATARASFEFAQLPLARPAAPGERSLGVGYRLGVTADPLAPLMELAGVAAATAAARERVDEALRHPALRRQGGQVAAEVSLRSAVASAALSGYGHEREMVRAGTITEPVLQGALRVATALDELAGRWPTAPRQVLARLHMLAARGVVSDDELGRPASSSEPGAADRLDTLVALVAGGTQVSPIVRAAVVHGELLALQPFAGPNAVVARAAARLTLISTGLDPRGLIAIDVGHHAREPEYVGAAGAFATGTPDGVRAWLRHYAMALEGGAAETISVADGVQAPRGRFRDHTWTAPHA